LKSVKTYNKDNIKVQKKQRKDRIQFMEQIIFRPSLFKFETCKEFSEAFDLKKGDLILTNQYIYDPYFGKLGLEVETIFQEQYGAGEPTDIMVDAIIEDAMKKGCKRIIAIGGGTIIDIAKVLSISAGESVDELYDLPVKEKKHPLIIIPTTCGTGSEVTNISIINRTRLGVKMGLTGEALFADSAVLIPELLEGLPFPVFATSSIDALVHAVESSLSPKATAYTKLFSYKAIEMIISGFQILVKEGKDTLKELLENFLIASNYAGLAFGTAGCAAVHALSYPLGGTYHVPHGESNYAVFTGVLKNYMEIKQDGEIEALNEYIAGLLECDVDEVYEKLEDLLNQILQKKALHEYGVKEEELEVFTKSVMETQGRLMANNFVPLDEERVLKIYKELY
jgi:4-hydroxybutyrate dehydrogenase